MSSTEMGDEVKKLESWSGDWGLPSIDYNCLAIEVFKRFLQYCHAEFMCEVHLIPETSKWMKGGNSNCILISLILQAYCRFSGIPLKVIQGNNPLKSPSGITKYLKFRSISPIFTYLTCKDIYFPLKLI